MPRRRNVKKTRRSRRSRRRAGAGPSGYAAPNPAPAENEFKPMAVHQVLSGTRQVVKTKDDWVDIAEFIRRNPRELKETKSASSPMVELKLLRGMFKADHPYRTRLGASFLATTSAAGVLNIQLANTSITSAAEWTSIDALFDEFFIHSCTVKFRPYNATGGGVSVGLAGQLTFSTAGKITSCGLGVVSLYNGAGYYTTADQLLSNPTRQSKMSNQSWDYVWRNNVRFDARGPAMSSATTESWQGWTLITNATNYGGTVQVRADHDAVIGDATNAVTLGTTIQVWDVSFRARA